MPFNFLYLKGIDCKWFPYFEFPCTCINQTSRAAFCFLTGHREYLPQTPWKIFFFKTQNKPSDLWFSVSFLLIGFRKEFLLEEPISVKALMGKREAESWNWLLYKSCGDAWASNAWWWTQSARLSPLLGGWLHCPCLTGKRDLVFNLELCSSNRKGCLILH